METYNNQQLLQEFLQRISWTPESGQQGYKTSAEMNLKDKEHV